MHPRPAHCFLAGVRAPSAPAPRAGGEDDAAPTSPTSTPTSTGIELVAGSSDFSLAGLAVLHVPHGLAAPPSDGAFFVFGVEVQGAVRGWVGSSSSPSSNGLGLPSITVLHKRHLLAAWPMRSVMSAGTRTFQFQLPALPEHAPASFEDDGAIVNFTQQDREIVQVSLTGDQLPRLLVNPTAAKIAPRAPSAAARVLGFADANSTYVSADSLLVKNLGPPESRATVRYEVTCFLGLLTGEETFRQVCASLVCSSTVAALNPKAVASDDDDDNDASDAFFGTPFPQIQKPAAWNSEPLPQLQYISFSRQLATLLPSPVPHLLASRSCEAKFKSGGATSVPGGGDQRGTPPLIDAELVASGVLQPLLGETKATFTLGKAPLVVKAQLPRGALCISGQDMIVRLSLSNSSNRSVSCIRVTLRRVVSLTGPLPAGPQPPQALGSGKPQGGSGVPVATASSATAASPPAAAVLAPEHFERSTAIAGVEIRKTIASGVNWQGKVSFHIPENLQSPVHISHLISLRYDLIVECDVSLTANIPSIEFRSLFLLDPLSAAAVPAIEEAVQRLNSLAIANERASVKVQDVDYASEESNPPAVTSDNEDPSLSGEYDEL